MFWLLDDGSRPWWIRVRDEIHEAFVTWRIDRECKKHGHIESHDQLGQFCSRCYRVLDYKSEKV